MSYLATNALQNLYRSLGKAIVRTATGGSTLTAIDTVLGEKYDDEFNNDGAIIVVRDSDGASAAPEGQISTITNYVQETQTFTFSPALTVAIAAGDTFMITTDGQFPYSDMLEIINNALQDLGPIPQKNDSLTSANNQTEYTLPAVISQKPFLVELQGNTSDSNDNDYNEIEGWRIVPSAIGTQWTLIIPQPASGRIIRVWYKAQHAKLTTYNSEISPSVDPRLVDAAAMAFALMWYNRYLGGGDDFWLAEEKKAWNFYNGAKENYDIKYPPQHPGRSLEGIGDN